MRGRGTNRRPNDLIVVMESGVARLQLDPERRTRIDRHGLWIHPSRVLGATTRRVREHVEREDQVHLCRGIDCQGGPGLHCASYAAVDAEALVDLGAYDRVSAWRFLRLPCASQCFNMSCKKAFLARGRSLQILTEPWGIIEHLSYSQNIIAVL